MIQKVHRWLMQLRHLPKLLQALVQDQPTKAKEADGSVGVMLLQQQATLGRVLQLLAVVGQAVVAAVAGAAAAVAKVAAVGVAGEQQQLLLRLLVIQTMRGRLRSVLQRSMALPSGWWRSM
jgi:hypothetical protein